MYKMILLFIATTFYSSCRSASCDEFFHDKSWPEVLGLSHIRTVQLCQTEGTSTTPFYATLFSDENKIPIYSANKVVLDPHQKEYDRPDKTLEKKLWKRLAENLCGFTAPTTTIFSAIQPVRKGTKAYRQCEQWQATNTDYLRSGFNRGHLAPCKINSRNQAKQWSTFTLTNAAPQYSTFNSHTWRIYECVTETSILQLVPNEPVYIITGVRGRVLDQNGQNMKLKNRVHVPGRFWKAVCYPGNGTKEAWGYAIVDENESDLKQPNPMKYKTLHEFASEYFADPPFGPECMKASFGEFGKHVFSQWSTFIHTHCMPNSSRKRSRSQFLKDLFYYY